MKTIRIARILFWVAVATLGACDESDVETIAVEEPAVTPEGIPIGGVVTKEIGANGGTITSIDGKVELEIPEGALRVTTTISVQPITAMVPGSVGNGYRFSPNGTQFDKPVTLKFKYEDGDIEGTLPRLLGIAYQDTDHVWYSLPATNVDIPKQKISTTTIHFTDFDFFASLRIEPYSAHLEIKESKAFRVVSVVKDPSDFLKNEELTTILPEHDVAAELVLSWSANGLVYGNLPKSGGHGPFGTIVSVGSGCTYTAPAVVPKASENPVSLSAKIKASFTEGGVTFNDLTLVSPVEIIGDLAYNLKVWIYDTQISGGISTPFTLRDSTSLLVVLEGNNVICTNFTNSPGIVVPITQTDALGKSTWVHTNGAYPGPLTVTNCEGIFTGFSSSPGVPSSLFLTLTGTSTSPDFDWVSISGDKVSIPGLTGPLFSIIPFDLNDSIPTWQSGTSFFATLTPIK